MCCCNVGSFAFVDLLGSAPTLRTQRVTESRDYELQVDTLIETAKWIACGTLAVVCYLVVSNTIYLLVGARLFRNAHRARQYGNEGSSLSSRTRWLFAVSLI